MTSEAKTEYDRLTGLVVAAHDGLSPQLRKVAQFLVENPQRVALMTIADLSETTGVPPSGVIRFCKALGFSGYSEVQRILKEDLSEQMSESYHARIAATDGDGALAQSVRLAEASMERLPTPDDIARATDLLTEARLIHVMAARRAFGAASYLCYMLGAFGAPISQISGVGGMEDLARGAIAPDDVLVAISFPNYRLETRDMVDAALMRGAKVLAITDSPLSPISKSADQVLLCDQPSEAGFRSLVGTHVVLQALALDYGARLQKQG